VIGHSLRTIIDMMAAKSLNPAEFVSALLNAIRELTGRRPPPTWTHVDKVQHKLATDNRDAVDAAIRVAVKKGWVRADGDPPASVTITVEGIKKIGLEPSQG
jgi:hypothetical protein